MPRLATASQQLFSLLFPAAQLTARAVAINSSHPTKPLVPFSVSCTPLSLPNSLTEIFLRAPVRSRHSSDILI